MIWKKPWKLAEGFTIGAGLIIVGLTLQLTIGPIDWSLFAWPANIIALAMLIVLVAGCYALRKHLYFCQFLTTYGAAVPALAFGAAMTVLMGLTRQETNGTWLNDMLTFWPFVLIYTYIVLILGMVTIKRLFHLTSMMRDIPFLLNHVGLFLALTTGTLGNADMRQLQMWTSNNPEMANMFSDSDVFHQYERFAMDEHGRKVELPLAIELKRFIMEMYEDSITPKRYASEIVIYSKESLHQYAATIDVNKPVEIDGWKIYQKDYRLTDAGDACQISIFELVSDPWLPWVYTGIFMMLGGAILLLLQGGKRTRKKMATEPQKDEMTDEDKSESSFVEPQTTQAT